MIILAIETSCDDTALALLQARGSGTDFEYRIIASIVHSQAALHSPYGGVFPALAKREHSKNLPLLLPEVLSKLEIEKSVTLSIETISACIKKYTEQNKDLAEAMTSHEFQSAVSLRPPIDLIAVTQGPGLEPALWTGIAFATMLAELWNIPLHPINHMEGHIVGSLLHNDQSIKQWQQLQSLPLPALALLISGGHTDLVQVQNGTDGAFLSYEIIGRTVDDAVGEAFDKAARLLGLPYPGGPHISRLADEARRAGIVSEIKLPRPMAHSKDLNFSFSGLKTAVLYAVKDAEKKGTFTEVFKKGLAREFEDAVKETLDRKLRSAIEYTDAQSIIVGGGVSANKTLRIQFETIAHEYGIPLFLPSQHISGDNALMIALAAALTSHDHPQSAPIHAQGTKKLGSI